MSSPILTKAVNDAVAAQKRIDRVADLLASLMQDMHGGDWRASISHECDAALIVVAPRSARGQKPFTPKPEIA
ncbi:hypothetical protein [Shinella sp.]|uniref:hypothetical protein n=1 Tax=Shinella sp. TaxID=1870904 RepID=UPI0028AEA32A|nr:hypothetical protein [Shinella sp.]